MHVILNPDRTHKNTVSVDEDTARSAGCPIDILSEDLFVVDAPTIPSGMYAPQLAVDFEALLAADPEAEVWTESAPLLRDAENAAENVRRIKAKAGEVIYSRYSAEKQSNMQSKYKVLESIMLGTYPNDDGTFGAARELTADEKSELLGIRMAWDWIVSVVDASNLAELEGTPAEEVQWPL